MVNFTKAAKESPIQYDILRHLNGLDMCKAIKILSANESGTPDIFCVYHGVPIILEVKASEKDAWAAMDHQKRQFMQLDQWRDTGARVMYVWSLDMVKDIICNIRIKL